jgi:predicted flap endonuclease-1-like 5' DNA nuclease
VPAPQAAAPAAPAPSSSLALLPGDGAVAERARLIRSFEAEAATLRRCITDRDATLTQMNDFVAERRRLFGDLAQARGETARYRQLVIDLEDNAPPPLLGGPGAPDDLKLIVGVGPMLERMLYQLGITTYRQIARWTERDIDDYDAKLAEFPGRIRRDGWVTQARALHQSKYGATAPLRDPR